MTGEVLAAGSALAGATIEAFVRQLPDCRAATSYPLEFYPAVSTDDRGRFGFVGYSPGGGDSACLRVLAIRAPGGPGDSAIRDTVARMTWEGETSYQTVHVILAYP